MHRNKEIDKTFRLILLQHIRKYFIKYKKSKESKHESFDYYYYKILKNNYLKKFVCNYKK